MLEEAGLHTIGEMIQTLIFDLGRVLVNVDYGRGCELMAERCGLPAGEVARRLDASQLLAPYERGQLSSRGFADKICAAMGASLSFEDWTAIWCSMFQGGPIVPAEFIESLHDRYRMVLLSNTSELHWNYLRDSLPALRHFDAFTLSFEVGATKPDAPIYLDAVSKAGCAAAECYFTDDTQVCIEGAHAVGIYARQFTAFEQLKIDLRGAGVVL